MPTFTNYKRLEKPLLTEKYNIAIANKNNDIIDSELHKLELKNESQDNLLATKETLNYEVTRATNKENELAKNLANEISRANLAESINNDNLTSHTSDNLNPHKVNKTQVGLNNVDNTSDISKPVSTAQQKAIDDAFTQSNYYTDAKIAELINGAPESLDTLKEISDALAENESVMDALNAAIGTKGNQTELDGHIGNDTIHVTKSDKDNWNSAFEHITNEGNPHKVNKAQLGLENVENKSSETIRSELTKENITTALGYTPSNNISTNKIVYVSPDGSDTIGTGTLSNPWREISYAVEQCPYNNNVPYTIIADGGSYGKIKIQNKRIILAIKEDITFDGTDKDTSTNSMALIYCDNSYLYLYRYKDNDEKTIHFINAEYCITLKNQSMLSTSAILNMDFDNIKTQAIHMNYSDFITQGALYFRSTCSVNRIFGAFFTSRIVISSQSKSRSCFDAVTNMAISCHSDIEISLSNVDITNNIQYAISGYHSVIASYTNCTFDCAEIMKKNNSSVLLNELNEMASAQIETIDPTTATEVGFAADAKLTGDALQVLRTNLATKASAADVNAIWKKIYPVGSIYMSTSSANPATLFGGGTWQQITGRFLLAAGGGYSAGSTGGEATHKLTVAEMPSHNHTWSIGESTREVARGVELWGPQVVKTYTTSSTGGNGAHNNMPPYLAVYVWKRTA